MKHLIKLTTVGLIALWLCQAGCTATNSKAMQLERAGHHEQAYELYVKQLQSNPNDPAATAGIKRTAPLAAAYWQRQAYQAAEQGDWQQAAQCHLRVLQIKPDELSSILSLRQIAKHHGEQVAMAGDAMFAQAPAPTRSTAAPPRPAPEAPARSEPAPMTPTPEPVRAPPTVAAAEPPGPPVEPQPPMEQTQAQVGEPKPPAAATPQDQPPGKQPTPPAPAEAAPAPSAKPAAKPLERPAVEAPAPKPALREARAVIIKPGLSAATQPKPTKRVKGDATPRSKPKPRPKRPRRRPPGPSKVDPFKQKPKVRHEPGASESEFIMVARVSREDLRYPKTAWLKDSLAVKVKDTDDDTPPDADIEIYLAGKRLRKFKNLVVDDVIDVIGTYRWPYEIVILDVYDPTETVTVGLRLAR